LLRDQDVSTASDCFFCGRAIAGSKVCLNPQVHSSENKTQKKINKVQHTESNEAHCFIHNPPTQCQSGSSLGHYSHLHADHTTQREREREEKGNGDDCGKPEEGFEQKLCLFMYPKWSGEWHLLKLQRQENKMLKGGLVEGGKAKYHYPSLLIWLCYVWFDESVWDSLS